MHILTKASGNSMCIIQMWQCVLELYKWELYFLLFVIWIRTCCFALSSFSDWLLLFKNSAQHYQLFSPVVSYYLLMWGLKPMVRASAMVHTQYPVLRFLLSWPLPHWTKWPEPLVSSPQGCELPQGRAVSWPTRHSLLHIKSTIHIY